MTISFILVAKSDHGATKAFHMRPQNGTKYDDGNFDVIIEGAGNLGLGFTATKLFIRDVNANIFITGAMSVIKKQMNVKSSDDQPLPTIDITFTEFNAAVDNAILVHDFGVSENPVALKINVTTAFTVEGL